MTPERVSRAAQVLKEYAVSIKNGFTFADGKWADHDDISKEAYVDYLEATSLAKELQDMVNRYRAKQKRRK